jgi:hypothetical protein
LDQIKKQESIAKHDKHLLLAFENLVVDAGNDRLREEEIRKAEKLTSQK